MAITKNLLPKCVKGHDTQQAKPNLWEEMQQAKQFIDSIDTTGGDVDDATKFNLLVSSVPSPWARVHLTQHALMNDNTNNGILSKFYKFLYDEWRGLVAAYVLYRDDFELTNPIDLVSKDIESSGKFDIISIYSEMLFENAPLWKYGKGDNENPKMQLLYYKNGDQRQIVGGTSPFSILFTGMNYAMPTDDERGIYWISPTGKFQNPTDAKYEVYFKKGGAKYDEKHFNNIKKLYAFLHGVIVNLDAYEETLKDIWENVKGDNRVTTDSRYQEVKRVLQTGISIWMNEIQKVIGNDVAEKSISIPVNHKCPEGPIGKLLNIKTTYYWRNNRFYTSSENSENEVIIEDIENLFINSNYLAIWKDDAKNGIDQFGRKSSQTELDYRNSPVHFIQAKDKNNRTWFLAVPLSEYALTKVFNDFVSIIQGKNDYVRIEAEKNGNKVDVYLKAKINGEGDFENIRNRSFNTETPNGKNKVFAWPNFSSPIWQKYYYYSEFPMNAPGDIQMVPVFDFEGNVDSENPIGLREEAFHRVVKYPDNAPTTAHPYEIIRTNKPLNRIKIRKRIGNGVHDLGWLILRKITRKVNLNEPQAMQVFQEAKKLTEATVGFDFGSTNSCAYYCTLESDIRPVPFSNRRLAIVGFDNKPINTADPDELLFISNEEPINKNGQIKSWLHEHDHTYIDSEKLGEEVIGGIPVNETNIDVHGMDRYCITTPVGKLHYNMKWLNDEDGSRRKRSFMKMIWTQICADLFADGMYPSKLNWSYPSAMSSKSMSVLEKVFKSITSPCGSEYEVKEMLPYTEAEAVCSHFLSKRTTSLEDYNLYVGIDIGGSTSDILVLGKESAFAAQQPVAAPVTAPVAEPVATPAAAAVNYDDMGRRELCDLVRQRGLENKVVLDDMGRGEIVEFLKANEVVAVDYDELSRKELCALALQRGLAGQAALDDMGRSEIVELLKANEPGAIDYDELSRKELSNLALQRGLANQATLDDMGRGEIVELLQKKPTTAAPRVQTTPATSYTTQSKDQESATDRRLFTQCSVRMAAGVFFDAIIKSKKFRDCIKNFHSSKETNIKVEGIENIELDPLRAPYYLNNIFDQLSGDGDFKKFYGYLDNDVPFVFTLPAYIVGALMTYTGVLVRNAIITNKLEKIETVHLRYFGKGGRLFEWLFFTFNNDEVNAYLNACFKVGLKNEEIDKAFGRNRSNINCTFENCKEYGNREISENKSEVAIGLVSQHSINGITKPDGGNIYNNSEGTIKEDDARKQEVIGEVGITRNGVVLNELDLVSDNFYEHLGNISMPRNFENFSKFMETFLLFVGQATNIYSKANKLSERIKEVCSVRSFFENDTEFKKYTSNIRSKIKDSYRMPMFIATALYYLEEVLLKEVFSNN